MYYQICISGTATPVAEQSHLRTEEEIQAWLETNQEGQGVEGDPGYDSWPYEDGVKYIMLRFDDDGVFMDGPTPEEAAE
jgi:hypothetical protein